MKRKSFSTLVLIGLLACVGIVMSCSDDDAPGLPGLELTEVLSTGMAGDVVSVTVSVTTDAAFESLVVTKLYNGVSQGIQTFDELASNEFRYEYTIIEGDAEQILSFNFLLTDAAGQEISRDWVVTVNLNASQLLQKFNWRLNDEIRAETNMSDIQPEYQDDVYQFNSDGTYQKSNGPLEDGFNDDVTIYCFWELTSDMDSLFMVRQDIWNGVTLVDTIAINVISETELTGDIIYYGLDQFDPTYSPVEEYEKQFVAVDKTSSFDPYGIGGDDDAGPTGECNANWKD